MTNGLRFLFWKCVCENYDTFDRFRDEGRGKGNTDDLGTFDGILCEALHSFR